VTKDIAAAGMKISREYFGEEVSTARDYERQLVDITRRCRELEERFPGKKELFQGYVRKQTEEYSILESELVCSTMVIVRI
jgi:hypothetical protein